MSTKIPRFSVNGEHLDQRKKQAVEALNKRYEELNKLWEAAEKELKQIPIPVAVSHCYKSVDNDPYEPGAQTHAYLGFVKSKGGWRICCGYSDDNFTEFGIEWKPIAECSVDLRLEAAPYIGELRQAVLNAAEECVPTLDAAIDRLRSTLQSW